MINTEIFVEGYPLDLMQDISTEFVYAIDDITDFGSKNTSYSKTINIAGTNNNNKIFGFIFDLGNANDTTDELPNVNYNFNASKAAQCRIFVDKVQIFKGTLRILEIIVEGAKIEYQCSVFGELGGFMSALGNKRLEDLVFPTSYNHTYNQANIIASWDNIDGNGYYYPLIDYGGVSDNKTDFDVKAFRPALFVKEYIEKIFADSGYKYDFALLNSDLFKRLIIPHNQKELSTTSSTQLQAAPIAKTYNGNYFNFNLEFTSTTLGNFTLNPSNNIFTYTGTSAKTMSMAFSLAGIWKQGGAAYLRAYKNGVEIGSYYVGTAFEYKYFTATISLSNVNFAPNDTLDFRMEWSGSQTYQLVVLSGSLSMSTSSTELVPINYNEQVNINAAIPKGIFQKDFFLSVAKMFNLYIYDDKWDNKKIIVKPFVDFYEPNLDNALDWSNKIDRSKPISIKPMSELNARYYHYKFKEDSDYYNENYKKKYNESYGDRVFDTNYDFSKDTEEVSVIFAPSVLFRGTGTDKIYPAIYKKSNENAAEDKMDSVIRILQAKKIITGIGNWTLKNNGTGLLTLNYYGYAGHLDDPYNPTNDINFGVPKEVFFNATTYPTTNLFNAYYSSYMAEITSKDSKLMSCYAYLNQVDILNLDFRKYIWIDGVLFRLNKVDGYDPMEYTTTKINLLKVIETTY